ncbi:MAG: hypothetical protein LIO71_01775 [Ruminococcus sp.]|nr:hypothetical protein [Ruminococcus sp.]
MLEEDKSIAKGIEHRKQYRGSKAFDRTCRNHGGCEVCLRNRMYKNLKRIQSANDKSTLDY